MSDEAVVAVISAILSGGLVSGWIAWRKAPVEADAILVGYHSKIIEDQRKELDRALLRVKHLEEKLVQRDETINRLNQRVLNVEAELAIFRDEHPPELA